MSRIPVTIITGFLGAGKTTLVNQIIQQNKDTKFFIIENEFGEINIDSQLVTTGEDQIFELTDGCLCCSLNTELFEFLTSLIDSDYEFDHLIVETTGVADPSGIAAAFVSDYEIQSFFKLDAVLAVVDSKNVAANLKENIHEVSKQISCADAVIFNKTDQTEAAYLLDLKKTILNIQPYAQTFEASFAHLNTSPLLELNAYEANTIEHKTEHHHHHDHQHHHITSQSYVFDIDFDFLQFRFFMNQLLTLQNSRIYRIKGVLSVANIEERIIFQSVQQQHIYSKGSLWNANEKRQSQIVVIGNDLNKKQFEKLLKRCLVKKL
jgi:G3E family GTPase